MFLETGLAASCIGDHLHCVHITTPLHAHHLSVKVQRKLDQ